MAERFENLLDLWRQASRRYAQRPLFGTKVADRTWSWMSYRQFDELVDACRGGLADLGVNEGDRVAIIAGNCIEWAATAYACYGLRASIVPLYREQTEADWRLILKDCAAKVTVCHDADVLAVITSLQEKLPALEHLIGAGLPEDDPQSFEALLARGRRRPEPIRTPESQAVASILYTSGTTSDPKGVMLTHGNVCANVRGIIERFQFSGERSLSFLPWSHAFGHTAELHTMVATGGAMALNDRIPNIVENLAVVQPTVFAAVPRVLHRIYDQVNAKLVERPLPIRRLFAAGMDAATKRSRGERLSVPERLSYRVADKLLFRTIRKRFGGRLKFVASAGAALNKDVAHFVDGLGIDVYEGYGLTETSPVCTLNYPGHRKIGSVGKAMPGVRIYIDPAESRDAACGEIIAFGPNVMQGYYGRPEESSKMFRDDGGFRTGDMGHLDEDGYLYVTGRIKEQYKLENGLYVVPAPLEDELKLSPLIANVMLHGANRPYNVALVVPDCAALDKWAEQEDVGFSELVENQRVRDLLLAELAKCARDFKPHEVPKDLLITAEDFTLDNGMLTPSLKLKRRVVWERYGSELERLYSRTSSPDLRKGKALRRGAKKARAG